jgi:hypothetical protein
MTVLNDGRARRRINREAQRRWYARQKRGEASYPVDVGPRVLDLLVHQGYLQEDETHDPLSGLIGDARNRRREATHPSTPGEGGHSNPPCRRAASTTVAQFR